MFFFSYKHTYHRVPLSTQDLKKKRLMHSFLLIIRIMRIRYTITKFFFFTCVIPINIYLDKYLSEVHAVVVVVFFLLFCFFHTIFKYLFILQNKTKNPNKHFNKTHLIRGISFIRIIIIRR